jgi:hypothetical protein
LLKERTGLCFIAAEIGTALTKLSFINHAVMSSFLFYGEGAGEIIYNYKKKDFLLYVLF